MLCLVTQSCPTLCDLMDCSPPPTRLLCAWNSPGKNTGVGCHSPAGYLPHPGTEPRSPAWQEDSFLLSHLGHPYNSQEPLISFSWAAVWLNEVVQGPLYPLKRHQSASKCLLKVYSVCSALKVILVIIISSGKFLYGISHFISQKSQATQKSYYSNFHPFCIPLQA